MCIYIYTCMYIYVFIHLYLKSMEPSSWRHKMLPTYFSCHSHRLWKKLIILYSTGCTGSHWMRRFNHFYVNLPERRLIIAKNHIKTIWVVYDKCQKPWNCMFNTETAGRCRCSSHISNNSVGRIHPRFNVTATELEV